ncbi:MAG: acylphosphatase [Sulfurimicrobium sp.]
MSESARVTKLLRLHGRVQGVFYRESMCRKAAELGVTGWVRNRRDGTVEALVQGDEKAVQRMLEWARRGPEMAQVTDMTVEQGSGSYAVFERRDTG